jgi:hypothetical protein
MLSVRRRLIAPWLIILELQNQTWADGSRPRRHVDCLGVTTLPAFACLVWLAMILRRFVDGTVGSVSCSMIFGCMIRGNAPGCFLTSSSCVFALLFASLVLTLDYLHLAPSEFPSPFEIAGD